MGSLPLRIQVETIPPFMRSHRHHVGEGGGRVRAEESRVMLAFTFPGQGSQCPGMGRPWVAHPSWELVTEASSLAGRDIGRLLLDADADGLRAPRNAQLATFVVSLVALDAIKQ